MWDEDLVRDYNPKDSWSDAFLVHLRSYNWTIRRIWAQLEAATFKEYTVAFDGRRLAFSLKDIGVDSTLISTTSLTIETFVVQLPEDDNNVDVSKRPPREFKIRIRKAGTLLTREILNFLNNKPHGERMHFTGEMQSNAMHWQV